MKHLIVGFPSAPQQPMFFPKSLTSAVLSWSSPTDSLCVTNYTITLTIMNEENLSYKCNKTTNTTSMTLLISLREQSTSSLLLGLMQRVEWEKTVYQTTLFSLKVSDHKINHHP